MSEHRLFFYGTLQHPDLCQRLLGRVPTMTAASIAGYRAAPIEGRVYPGLVVDPDSRAPGVIVSVTPDERALLDDFEGPGYDRITVEAVLDGGGDTVDVDVWLLGDASRTGSGAWDFGRFAEAAAREFVEESMPGEVHPGERT